MSEPGWRPLLPKPTANAHAMCPLAETPQAGGALLKRAARATRSRGVCGYFFAHFGAAFVAVYILLNLLLGYLFALRNLQPAWAMWISVTVLGAASLAQLALLKVGPPQRWRRGEGGARTPTGRFTESYPPPPFPPPPQLVDPGVVPPRRERDAMASAADRGELRVGAAGLCRDEWGQWMRPVGSEKALAALVAAAEAEGVARPESGPTSSAAAAERRGAGSPTAAAPAASREGGEGVAAGEGGAAESGPWRRPHATPDGEGTPSPSSAADPAAPAAPASASAPAPPPPSPSSPYPDPSLEYERFCRTCSLWRPPRASHCATCGYCMERFDHQLRAGTAPRVMGE